MKKLVMITGFLMLTFCLRAQLIPFGDSLSHKEKKFAILTEAALGLVNSSITGESDSYNGLLTGFELGIGINVVKFSDDLGLRSGIMYSRQGGKYSEKSTYEPGGGGSYGGGDGKLRLDYINIPVVARYQTEGGFFAEAGLQPGFLVGAKNKFNGTTNDAKDEVNKFDLGAIAGCGYRFGKHVGVSARVVPGLTNINKKQSGYAAKKDHNLVIGIRGSYFF